MLMAKVNTNVLKADIFTFIAQLIGISLLLSAPVGD